MATIRINMTGKNLEITEALRSYVEKKAAKLEKYLNDNKNYSAEVMLRTERGIHIAEVTMNLSGVLLRGEGKTGDMYTSIDNAVDRIERQFNKYRSKLGRRAQGPKLAEVQASPQEGLTRQHPVLSGQSDLPSSLWMWKKPSCRWNFSAMTSSSSGTWTVEM